MWWQLRCSNVYECVWWLLPTFRLVTSKYFKHIKLRGDCLCHRSCIAPLWHLCWSLWLCSCRCLKRSAWQRENLREQPDQTQLWMSLTYCKHLIMLESIRLYIYIILSVCAKSTCASITFRSGGSRISTEDTGKSHPIKDEDHGRHSLKHFCIFLLHTANMRALSGRQHITTIRTFCPTWDQLSGSEWSGHKSAFATCTQQLTFDHWWLWWKRVALDQSSLWIFGSGFKVLSSHHRPWSSCWTCSRSTLPYST